MKIVPEANIPQFTAIETCQQNHASKQPSVVVKKVSLYAITFFCGFIIAKNAVDGLSEEGFSLRDWQVAGILTTGSVGATLTNIWFNHLIENHAESTRELPVTIRVVTSIASSSIAVLPMWIGMQVGQAFDSTENQTIKKSVGILSGIGVCVLTSLPAIKNAMGWLKKSLSKTYLDKQEAS